MLACPSRKLNGVGCMHSGAAQGQMLVCLSRKLKNLCAVCLMKHSHANSGHETEDATGFVRMFLDPDGRQI